MGVEEVEGLLLLFMHTSFCSGEVRLQKQPCMATVLVDVPFGIQLLNVYLLLILIRGTFLLPAVDFWLFHRQ